MGTKTFDKWIGDYPEEWHRYAKEDCGDCSGSGIIREGTMIYDADLDSHLALDWDTMCLCIDWARIAEDCWLLDE